MEYYCNCGIEVHGSEPLYSTFEDDAFFSGNWKCEYCLRESIEKSGIQKDDDESYLEYCERNRLSTTTVRDVVSEYRANIQRYMKGE